MARLANTLICALTHCHACAFDHAEPYPWGSLAVGAEAGLEATAFVAMFHLCACFDIFAGYEVEPSLAFFVKLLRLP